MESNGKNVLNKNIEWPLEKLYILNIYLREIKNFQML